MKQITAVEWLVEQMINQMELRIENTQIGIQLFEQAKEMEKERLMHAYGQGVADEAGEIVDATRDAEEYYNKTYKSKQHENNQN
jgi:hypothetical protein